ncbi:DUF4838 domain-containing protein [Cohnella zeiphila]|uniref:DUF4838 domain-containing protein n=1 Tax=Cohnella zeiphila TaxID=2761120 RepID=A0A7X0SL89_9BACL|nr:DUF4838 domain-containing protein [Cohnella zeiphila]
MKHRIVHQGQSDWRIVVGRHASASEIHAGKELQRYIRKMTGVRLPVLSDRMPAGAHELIVGANEHTASKGISVDLQQLGNEGFIIRSTEDSLVLAGSNVRGTLYAVYTFLEDWLGCRWFAPGVTRIPENATIELEPLDICQIPTLEYRDSFSYMSFDGNWSAYNKMNGNFARLTSHHGGKMDFTGRWVHTFNMFVPVEKYFDTHPEYFSEVNGARIADRPQLCLTNEEVLKIMIERIRDYIEEHPGINAVSVSQNDWYNPCRCANCRAIDEAEGSHSGTLIAFVNKVAEAIETDYPEVAIETLAYQYTRKPPRSVRPRHNVIVRLCSIECCFAHPLETCEVAMSFRNRTGSDSSFASDLKAWGKISDRLHIWDYVTNFSNYVMPFPNFGVLKDNIRFFIRHNVKGIFEQGNPMKGGEFQELRTYVIAKLLWNPDYDVDQAVNEFMKAFYGKAAPPIRAYFDLIHTKVRAEHIHMGIYDPPTSDFLPADLVAAAAELFDEAERLADDEQILNRVQLARLPIRYVQLSQMPTYTLNRKAMVDQFFRDVQAAGIEEIWEGRPLQKSRMFMEEGTVFKHGSL